jgi:DNA-binding winged helix-turn-helix (wHTH) protein
VKTEQSKLFYEFGPFRLDTTERLLWREGEIMPLTPKAFDTLVALIEKSGRLVEKEELMTRLWPDTFVEEANLAQHISHLRKVFEDGPNGNKYIQTVPRRGYRWVAALKECRNDERPSEPQIEEASQITTQAAQQAKRVSLWEVHPIYKFEVCTSNCTGAGTWLPLDQWL